MGSKKQIHFGDIGVVEIWAQALRGEDEETEKTSWINCVVARVSWSILLDAYVGMID